MPIEPGTLLNQYRVVAKIGEGGMGEVYRATDTRLMRDVAIKVLPAELSGDEDRLARLEREAQVLAQLEHPNVAAIYGLEQAGDTRLLVMQLAEGSTLADRIAVSAMPAGEVAEIAVQVAAGLEAAHEKGIVHRDLKPANVMLADDGTVKILDFGLAKATEEEGSRPSGSSDLSASPTAMAPTAAGMILGTAPYMSPEQARGKAVDKRTDVWAFGCVLYEMLSGRRAFAGETATDVIAAILTRDPDWDALPRSVPAPVRALIERCLEKNPLLRLRDIGEARIALSNPAEAEVAPDSDTQGVPEKAGLRPSIVAALGAAGLVIGLIGWVAGAWLGPKPDASPPRGRQLTFSDADWDPAVSVTAGMIAFMSSRDGRRRIWLKQLSGGGERALVDATANPRFSPDGSAVLYGHTVDGTTALYRIPSLGGQPRKIVDGSSDGDWSPDGQTIAFTRWRQRGASLYTVDLGGGNERELLAVENMSFFTPRFSPDGRTIAITQSAIARGAVDSLLLVDAASGTVRNLSPTGSRRLMTGVSWTPDGSSLVFGITESTTGDRSGFPSRVVRYEIDSGKLVPLFWAQGLFPNQGSMVGFSTIEIHGPDSLLYAPQESSQNLYEVALPGETPGERGRQITRGSAQDRQPDYSPDGSRVIFSSSRSGNLDLWELDLASGALLQLTDDPAQDWDPAYTPDGETILWSSDRSGTLEIWAASVDGSNARQISQNSLAGENPTMTADGEWILYVSSSPTSTGIHRMRPDGSDDTLIFAGASALPEVSPDGRLVSFTWADSAGEWFIDAVNVATGEHHQGVIRIEVESLDNIIAYGRTRWLSDSRIAFLGQDESGHTGIYAQDFVPGQDTSATRSKLAGFHPDAVTESFGIAPDGRTIIVAREQPSRSLMVVDRVTGLE